jgi:pilus assembly protein FimV
VSCLKKYFYEYNHMSLNTYQTMSIVGKAASVAAIVTIALPMAAAHAAGLGKITVLSALGQPLKAEIELTNVSNRERGSLVAAVGKPEDFANAKIAFDPVFSSLNFAIKQQGERDIIEVTSTQPINLALVNMLVEVTGGRRRLLREYSFLLDSPRAQRDAAAQAGAAKATTPAKPAAAATPAVQTPPAVTPPAKPAAVTPVAPAEVGKPAPEAAKPVPAPVAAEAADPAIATSGDHRVVNGDMLSKIALRYKPKGVSLNQMMIALYRANPDAFVNNNINRLKSGKILALPTADAARSVDVQEARSVVIAHTEDFNEYRNQLAGKVGAGTAKKAARTAQSAEGKVAVKVEENKPAAQPQDKLTLSKADAGASAENAVASGKAKAEADTRVQELEKNVADLQKLLEVQNQTLAPSADVAPQAGDVAGEDSDRVAEIKDKAAELTEGAKAAGEQAKEVVTPLWTQVKEALVNVSKNPLTWPIVGGLLLLGGGLYAWRRRQAGQAAEGDADTVADEQDGENEVAPATGIPETIAGTPEQSAGAGGLTFDVSGLAETDEALTAEQPAPNLADKIDFDLDLDSGNVPADEPVLDAAAATEPAAPAPVAPAAPAAPVTQAAQATTPAAPAVETTAAAAPAPAPVAPAAPAAPAAPVVAQATPAEEKLELDLPPAEPQQQPKAAGLEEEMAFSVEMNMKLDLAAAYQEIGDNEGARELLEEVIKGGNEELATRAREMMDALV